MALDDTCYGLEFSPDNAYLATSSDNHFLRIWKISSGQRALLRTADHEPSRSAPIVTQGWAISVDFTGTCLVTGSEARTATVFRTSDGLILAQLRHTSPVLSVATAPRCELVALGGSDGRIALWRSGAANPSGVVQLAKPVNSLAMNGDGSLLLSASDDGTARIWDVKSAQQRQQLSHRGSVHAAFFLNTEGTRILTVAPDMSAVWDAQSGRRVATLKNIGGVSSVAIAVDGSCFALGTRGTDRIRAKLVHRAAAGPASAGKS
jgi:WD40 repeat protein